MSQTKFTNKHSKVLLRQNRFKVLILMVAIRCIASTSIFSQTITSVSPDSAAQGTSGLLVTFILSGDTITMPPPDAPVNLATIGTIKGTSLTHNDTVVTGIFNIPLTEEVGPKDVAVTFVPPPDQGQPIVFSLPGGFTVNKMADTAPSITSQPKSKDVQLGSLVTFSVDVYGSLPITYQWQKDGADIDGATNNTYTINAVAESDTGFYRCIAVNDYGSDTSNAVSLTLSPKTYEGTYPIVDTDQSTFYDTATVISVPSASEPFYGQDAQYFGNQPSYTDNGDGTVTDNVTGLMWQQSFDHNGDGNINVNDKLSYKQILALVDSGYTFAGYSDWRLPSIKEQYSLMKFSGKDVSGYSGSTDNLSPFINSDVFEVAYGDTTAGERIIDVQCATTNVYVGDESMVFGVNFADGRIKGYGMTMMGQPKKFNYLLVRSNEDYGINSFEDNNDGTITDKATGLMWMKDDNGKGVTWEEALTYAENYEYDGYNDWRLPNIKELQSILDYSRSPSTTNSAAIDPIFNTSQITNEAGEVDYPWYWSGTTHANMMEGHEGAWAAYMAFGRAMGNNGTETWVDVHGAGAQRSDPKSGDPAEFSDGHGPQGDAVRIYNYVRLVRDIKTESSELDYKINETGQTKCYDTDGNEIEPPAPGEPLYGQDAQFPGNPFNFQDNGDGTVTDLNTALTWQKAPINRDFTWYEAQTYCDTLTLAGYDDWRMPTAKELFSMENFENGWPYLDTDYFELAGDKIDKDQQYWTSNHYVGVTTEGRDDAAFGVNFGTGHIKAYPANSGGPIGGKFVRAVRGEPYGQNDFVDNGNGTITDRATGLMWTKSDLGPFDWPTALSFADTAKYAEYSDWRIPNVKELQSIVDYSYSPTATDPNLVGPAIDPIFNCTPIKNEAGNDDYAYYWTSTSARFNSSDPFYYAWYVAFGTAVNPDGFDTHGAGAVRFDTKVENGPLGEGGERYYNFVRLVRNVNGSVTGINGSESNNLKVPNNFELKQNYPNPFNPSTQISVSVPESGNYTLKVYNILGQEVATLLNSKINAGNHTFNFDASNLTSGIYFYTFRGNNVVKTKKMILMK